jgi:hypothetical protein
VIREKVKAQMPDLEERIQERQFGGYILKDMADEAEEKDYRGPKDLAENMDEYLYEKK